MTLLEKEQAKTREPNRLTLEKSPYLLQHAYNPVNWFPWGDEAFARAVAEDKPIFLSIGYSTCHWCHVMERESFEDEEVAEVLNQHFIAIKVDREERPDVDHIYMNVCQAITGHGGWPLTIFMTPEKKPFYAGTYFPKQGRGRMVGLMELLAHFVEKWEKEQQVMRESSEQIIDAITPRLNQFVSGELDEGLVEQAYKQFVNSYDQQYGGFNQAPKFPTPHQYMFLLRYYSKTKDKNALEMVENSLNAMFSGGIYDHIGFGFSRYSTDRKWLVPHFEKMLYDNALLAYTCLETYQVTKNKAFAEVSEQIFTYLLRDMQDSAGGFYSAEDADSEGVEGKFYVWSKEEVLNILGDKLGELFCEVYNISAEGNFEGNSIPNLLNTSLGDIAKENSLSIDELKQQLEAGRKKLFMIREQRIHPHKDDKILTAWNGLLIAALAKGAQVLNRPEFSSAADRAIEFIFKKLRSESGRLLARYRDGEAKYPAYLDDYAFMIWGLIEQYEATYDAKYLQSALELNQQLKDLFWDEANGGYFFYGSDSESLFARPKEIYDGALPSGNSVAALNLLRLARITGDPTLEEDGEKQLKAFVGTVKEYPSVYPFFLSSLLFSIGPTKEIVISGNLEDTDEMLRQLKEKFLPNAVILFHPEEGQSAIEKIAPFIAEQKAINGQPTVYICENFACQKPITEIAELLQKI